MIIRQENAEDFSRIYELVKVAFQTAEVTSGQEQELVGKLRNSANYIPELALVAEENGELLGHIILKKAVESVCRGCAVILSAAVVTTASSKSQCRHGAMAYPEG